MALANRYKRPPARARSPRSSWFWSSAARAYPTGSPTTPTRTPPAAGSCALLAWPAWRFDSDGLGRGLSRRRPAGDPGGRARRGLPLPAARPPSWPGPAARSASSSPAGPRTSSPAAFAALLTTLFRPQPVAAGCVPGGRRRRHVRPLRRLDRRHRHPRRRRLTRPDPAAAARRSCLPPPDRRGHAGRSGPTGPPGATLDTAERAHRPAGSSVTHDAASSAPRRAWTASASYERAVHSATVGRSGCGVLGRPAPAPPGRSG